MMARRRILSLSIIVAACSSAQPGSARRDEAVDGTIATEHVVARALAADAHAVYVVDQTCPACAPGGRVLSLPRDGGRGTVLARVGGGSLVGINEDAIYLYGAGKS